MPDICILLVKESRDFVSLYLSHMGCSILVGKEAMFILLDSVYFFHKCFYSSQTGLFRDDANYVKW